jgi:hypothetical protein
LEQRYEILGRETNLSSPLFFIKVAVPSEGREWHVFAMGIDFTSVSEKYDDIIPGFKIRPTFDWPLKKHIPGCC